MRACLEDQTREHQNDAGNQPSLPQHCLNFLPDPQGHGALRPEFSMEKLGLRFGRFSLSVGCSSPSETAAGFR